MDMARTPTRGVGALVASQVPPKGSGAKCDPLPQEEAGLARDWRGDIAVRLLKDLDTGPIVRIRLVGKRIKIPARVYFARSDRFALRRRGAAGCPFLF